MFLNRSDCYDYWLYRRHRHRRQMAFGMLVLLTLVLLTARLHHPAASGKHHHHQHPAATRTRHRPATAHHPATPPPRTRRSVKPPKVTLAEADASAATGLRWASFHGIELPSSAKAGPRHTRAGLAWGFADTPSGALVAALNIAVRTGAQWGPAIYQPTISHQVTGPAKAALLAADASDYAALRAAAGVRPGQPAGRGYAVEAAYRFPAWAPASATVAIVSEGPAGNGTTVLAVTTIALRWLGGDWQVLAPPGGNWARSATAATTLAGYIRFPIPR